MATPQFVTVAHELKSLALGVWAHYSREPGKLIVERQQHDYPETATMFRQVGSEQHFIICEAKIREERLDLWVSYGNLVDVRHMCLFASRIMQRLRPQKSHWPSEWG